MDRYQENRLLRHLKAAERMYLFQLSLERPNSKRENELRLALADAQEVIALMESAT